MKRKIKIILLIIVIIAVLGIIFYKVDSNRAKNNQKPLFCIKTGTLLDGGSTEFMYEDYTILKYSTLDGLEDLVIGYKGQIINEVNRVIDK